MRCRFGTSVMAGVAAGLLLNAGLASGALLYQDTFETGDPVDYTAVTNSITHGLPSVVGPEAGMTSSAARFSTVGNQPDFFYDQAQYAIATEVRTVSLSFDVLFANFVGAPNLLFTVIFDAPTVNYLQFRSDGTLFATGFGSMTFTNDTVLHVTARFDEATRRWSSMVNGLPFSSSQVSGQTPDLRDVRFSMGFQTGSISANAQAAVYLDNVVIAAVPLPGGLVLLVSALVGLAAGTGRGRLAGG